MKTVSLLGLASDLRSLITYLWRMEQTSRLWRSSWRL